MEEFATKKTDESGEKEIIYSKSIKAGKRIYYLDVKRNIKGELFLAITESKKIRSTTGKHALFEKHKIFLYKEDFNDFVHEIKDIISYINTHNVPLSETSTNETEHVARIEVPEFETK